MADPRSRAVSLLMQARLATGHSSGELVCPCCQHGHERFDVYVTADGQQIAQCPTCGSHPRHRAFALLFGEWLTLARPTSRLLHVAPEPSLRAVVGRHWRGSVFSLDLLRRDVDVRASIESLPISDASLDVILCGHVLEHVEDETAALGELGRVLRPDGWIWLPVPIDPTSPTAVEETDDAVRGLRLGEHDHHRRYGRDFAQHLSRTGLVVTPMSPGDTLSADALARSSIDAQEPAVIARPGAAPGALSLRSASW